MIKLFSELKEGDRFSETDSSPQFEAVEWLKNGRLRVVNLRTNAIRSSRLWIICYHPNHQMFVED